jgi:hypothetical protein
VAPEGAAPRLDVRDGEDREGAGSGEPSGGLRPQPALAPTLAAEQAAADRLTLQGPADRPGDRLGAAEPGGLADRVADAVERLKQAPPPRSVVLDLSDVGGGRLAVSLRGNTVLVTVLTPAGVSQPPSADWSRDLASALAGRGFELGASPDGNGRDHGDQSDRQARDHRPERPSSPSQQRLRRAPRPPGGGVRL